MIEARLHNKRELGDAAQALHLGHCAPLTRL